jgi:hypothetical protein
MKNTKIFLLLILTAVIHSCVKPEDLIDLDPSNRR